MPKQLLICTHACGSKTLGGQCKKWKDVIHTDLHRLGAENNYRQKAQDHSLWWQDVEDAVLARNTVEEIREEMKDKSKRRREQHAAGAVESLVCPVRGCSFMTCNTSGLVNHHCQWYSTLRSVLCLYCQGLFAPEGIKNNVHRCFEQQQKGQ